MTTMQHMLTTIDNPYNPFIDFDEWLVFDETKGYYSSNLLARICVTSDELSDVDQDLAIEIAIDDIIRMNDTGLYKKVSQLRET